MLQLTVTVHDVELDYSQYVDWHNVKITEKINIPSQCTFSLTATNALFRVPPPRAYIKIYSTRWERSLFTGFITSKPVRRYLGLVNPSMVPGGQLFRYDVACTSDEHLLNMKSVPFIPAYVNRGQGQILTDLADILCSGGFFDTSMVASGDLVPYFEYDPRSSWCEIAKQFGDGIRFRYKVRDKKIVYQPLGDAPLGIEYNEERSEGTFDPKGLQTTILNVPIVNDVTIIGDTEGGNNREDYFIGVGLEGNFPLRHKMFRGASTVLVQESWNGGSFNLQQWYVWPPENVDFDLSVGALNIVTDFENPHQLDESYVAMNNGLELAGGILLDHGEFTFNEKSKGIIGGIYQSAIYTSGQLWGGFKISTDGDIVQPQEFVTPAGQPIGGVGVGGVSIQPVWAGQDVGSPVITTPNHSYVLQTVITAPRFTRYQRKYRTMEGEVFGGTDNYTIGWVTFNVLDSDILAATGLYYIPKVYTFDVPATFMPSFGTYALINNEALNLTLTNTTITTMPLGSLTALVGPSGLWSPTGLILPHLPPDSGDYIGPVQPWAGSGSDSIFPPPAMLGTVQTNLVLGNGYRLQAAQITAGNEADTLAFYRETMPAAGTVIRFQSWQQQAAVARLQVEQSIKDEAWVVGDDGVRSAVVSDLNPLPRTSEDCDNAALAFLKDRVRPFYNGTYSCTNLFFEGLTADEQFWPTVGRFLHVNAPFRDIEHERFLVVGLTISVLEEVAEWLKFDIQFGADLHLEKVLKNFVNLQPPQVLAPSDKAKPPDPRFTQDVRTSYLPDLDNVQIDPNQIHADRVVILVYDQYFDEIEVRKQDINWGKGTTPDYVGTFNGPIFELLRHSYEETWFLRPVRQGKTSRRSKVLRLKAPLRPSPPMFVSQETITVPGPSGIMTNTLRFQMDYTGDIRNIYGFEVRGADNRTILVQKPCPARTDLEVDLSQTPFLYLTGPEGEWLKQQYDFYPYFWNVRWDYSPVQVLQLIPPGIEGAPGEAPFQVRAEGYAMLTIQNLHILQNQGVGVIKEIDFLAPSVDETDIGLWLQGSIDGSTDPVTFTVSASGQSRLGTAFSPGDYVVWNDETIVPTGLPAPTGRYCYECDQIVAVNESSFTLARHPLGAPAGQAHFGSYMSSHSGKRLYRLLPRNFTGAVMENVLGATPPTTQSGIPAMWEFPWPNKTVVAVQSQAVGDKGKSPIYTLNLAPDPDDVAMQPPSPGLRTMNGAAYTNIGRVGRLSVGNRAQFRIKVQAWESIRTVYAYVRSAPQGADLILNALYITPTGVEKVIETVTIPAGSVRSWTLTYPPDGRQMPYERHWPPNVFDDDVVMEPDGELDFIITQVGSTNEGSDLILVVQT